MNLAFLSHPQGWQRRVVFSMACAVLFAILCLAIPSYFPLMEADSAGYVGFAFSRTAIYPPARLDGARLKCSVDHICSGRGILRQSDAFDCGTGAGADEANLDCAVRRSPRCEFAFFIFPENDPYGVDWFFCDRRCDGVFCWTICAPAARSGWLSRGFSLALKSAFVPPASSSCHARACRMAEVAPPRHGDLDTRCGACRASGHRAYRRASITSY